MQWVHVFMDYLILSLWCGLQTVYRHYTSSYTLITPAHASRLMTEVHLKKVLMRIMHEKDKMCLYWLSLGKMH